MQIERNDEIRWAMQGLSLYMVRRVAHLKALANSQPMRSKEIEEDVWDAMVENWEDDKENLKHFGISV